MREHSYSRRHRFSGVSAFAPVLRSGDRVRSAEATLVTGRGVPGASRFGIVLPRRLVRKATARNRMKRIAREAFRLHAARTRGLDIVLLPRAAYGRGQGQAWSELVRRLLARVAP